MIAEPRQAPDESMDLARLGALWRGEIDDEYGEAAVVGTLAIALAGRWATRRTPPTPKGAREALWSARDRDRLAAAA